MINVSLFALLPWPVATAINSGMQKASEREWREWHISESLASKATCLSQPHTDTHPCYYPPNTHALKYEVMPSHTPSYKWVMILRHFVCVCVLGVHCLVWMLFNSGSFVRWLYITENQLKIQKRHEIWICAGKMIRNAEGVWTKSTSLSDTVAFTPRFWWEAFITPHFLLFLLLFLRCLELLWILTHQSYFSWPFIRLKAIENQQWRSDHLGCQWDELA